MLAFRMAWSGAGSFRFLTWNLVLAVVPLLFSGLAAVVSRSRWKRIALLFLVPWLLFFPNAPYLLTDLLHLKARHPIPMWYDLLMLLSFALNGLVLGYVSLRTVESVLERTTTRTIAACATFLVMFLSAFGIYLGRFRRWNSWDLWHSPSGLVADILPVLLRPADHPRTWMMTLLMGLFLYLGYRVARGFGTYPAGAPRPFA